MEINTAVNNTSGIDERSGARGAPREMSLEAFNRCGFIPSGGMFFVSFVPAFADLFCDLAIWDARGY